MGESNGLGLVVNARSNSVSPSSLSVQGGRVVLSGNGLP